MDNKILIIVEVLAILLSPVIALWIGGIIRKRNRKKEEKYEILKKLIAFRYQLHSHEFLSALNSIILVFHDNKQLKEMVKNLHYAYTNGEKQEAIDQKIVELIFEASKITGYKVEEYEIKNLFRPVVAPQTSTPDYQEKNSTCSDNSGLPSEINNSISNKESITSGNL